MLNPDYGLEFADLYTVAGAARIDAHFNAWLAAADSALSSRYGAARAAPSSLDRKDEAALLIAVAPHLEDFLARLFGIDADVRELEARHHELAPLFTVKRLFVQRKALNAYKGVAAEALDGPGLRAALEARIGPFDELAFARAVIGWQQDEAANADALDCALKYVAWAAQTASGKAAHKGGVLFRAPRKLDFMRLVPLATTLRHGVPTFEAPADHLRRREGFALTDHGTDLAGALDQAHYCIWCHEQGKDSCSTGCWTRSRSRPTVCPHSLQDQRLRRTARGLSARGEASRSSTS